MFVLTAEKNVLTIQQKETLTSGSVNVCRVRFSFSADWDGLDKIAVFRVRKRSWSVLLDENNECIIPWEALKEPRLNLFCGVYGTRDDSTVLPTIWCSFGQIASGAAPGEEPRPRTPKLWEQELAKKSDALSYDGVELSLLAGGKTGQVLVKNSDDDYDVGWGDAESKIVVPSASYLFGYDINLNDPNPDTRVIYPNGVDNTDFAAAKMDFETGTFDYGGWPGMPGQAFMPKPCLLQFDGTVAYYLNPDDYSKKADGSRSDIDSFSCGGNFMMEWPKIYTKRWESGGTYHFRCSDKKIDNDYECWCNYDINDKEIDHFYMSIYTGSKDDLNRLRSISSRDSMVSQTAQTEIDYAKNNGSDIWYTYVTADYLLLMDLLVMMFKTTELQGALGDGALVTGTNDSDWICLSTGTMDNKGMFWGSKDLLGRYGVKAFGIENVWGAINKRIAGWLNVSGKQMLKITRGRKDGSTVNDYNITGSGYLTISNSTISGTNGGYISSCLTTNYGRIPVKLNGSSATYEADIIYYSNSGIGYQTVSCSTSSIDVVPTIGPYSNVLLNNATYTRRYVGTYLSCKPLAKEE